MKHLKSWAIIVAVTAFATGAQAQRPLTTAMPCFQAQRIVASRGAAVLGTGPYTYDRFVRDLSFCQVNEYLQPAWVPARDTPQCFVGYRCKTGPRELFDF
ncbi:hypothetical protein [Microvirga terricola]|uniref:Uncharacterized protein n=1 Tax=Microvirga terricola TaxID=2719797 RepID=A0ABX0VFB5_9HYPH|nr:hypothetical protein [Microvirga terricola]NIX76587.1 hypothetical protein [Microvirga terricola]